jgi:hypothetical protein
MNRRGTSAVFAAAVATLAVTWGISTFGSASLGGPPSADLGAAGPTSSTSSSISSAISTSVVVSISRSVSPSDGRTSRPIATVPLPTDPAAPSAPAARPTIPFHSPTPGEHWQSGRTLALPCGTATNHPAATTLLRSGEIRTSLKGYRQPVLRLRDGGRLDLADGVLGYLGAEYLLGGADQQPLRDVPPGAWPVTLAELWDRTWDPGQYGPWLAAAELRLSSGVPTHWVDGGGAITDGATLAWYGPAALDRVLATGYDPLTQLDARGRTEIDVTSAWDTPCVTLDVAPRRPSQPHDVLVIPTGADGGYGQYLGLDTGGRPAAVVIVTRAVPWAVLALPGTPPPHVDG